METAKAIDDEQKKAETLCAKVKPKMDELREYVDALENLVDDGEMALPEPFEGTIFADSILHGLLPKRYPFERPLKAFCLMNQSAAKDQ